MQKKATKDPQTSQPGKLKQALVTASALAGTGLATVLLVGPFSLPKLPASAGE